MNNKATRRDGSFLQRKARHYNTKNFASVPKEIKKELLEKNYFLLLDNLNLSPEKKYQKIKEIHQQKKKELWELLNNQNLSFEERCQEIKNSPYWQSMGMSRLFSAYVFADDGTMEKEELDQIYDKLRTEKWYEKYLAIKDKPNLTKGAILNIYIDMPSWTAEYEEIKQHYEQLERKSRRAQPLEKEPREKH